VTVRRLVVALVAVSVPLVATACRESRSDAGPVAAPSTTVDPAAWCAALIDLHTRNGTMIDRTFVPGEQVDPADVGAVAAEMVRRRDELLALTPAVVRPELDAVLTVVADRLAARADPLQLFRPATAGRPSSEDLLRLAAFQQSACGIRGL